MIARYFLCTISVGIIISACHSTKKNTVTKSDEPVIQLDTIQVLANEPVTNEIYRGSAPILNDIIHTELQVTFDWKNCKLYGKASIQLKPHFYSTDKLYLNARGMEIKSIEVFDVARVTEKSNVGDKVKEEVVAVWNTITASSYKYVNDTIKINLGRPFSNKETYYVEIEYIAKPNELKSRGSNAITDDKGLYFINPNGENPYKMPQIWTQGETQSSSAWFPTIDNPNIKMTQEIYMTVEDKYTTLSNGVLAESKKGPDGMRTDYWKLDLPHSPYLVMMAVGEFKKVTDQPWNGKEISYYVEKDYEPYAKAIFGDTREMIEFYSTKLGVPYVWPKYAQIVARDYVSGAMENTSATLHGDFMVYQTPREMVDGKKGNSVIAHELFHQWFGDLVTCESWSNLPLNESFATYGEYLWEEHKNGREAADHHAHMSKLGYLHSDKKEVDLVRFNYDDKEDMFDAYSYNKGGQVLHMLRKTVGDDAFFASLKKYLETNKYKAAEIHHLRLAFEDVTGKDMNWFFNQWFLNKGRPKLKVTKNYIAASNRLELTVEQMQDFKTTPLYTLPIEVDIYADGNVDRKHILITEAKKTFTLVTDAPPQLVNFDAERQLLCDLDYSKTTEEYIFQYKNAPLYGDRYEALEMLESKLSEPSVFALFNDAAKNDKFYALRDFAISKLESGPTDKTIVKTILIDVLKAEKNPKTKTKALESLNKLGNDPEIMALNEKALQEQSYSICGEALTAIATKDPKLAMEKAKLFENESGKKVLFPVAELYAKNGGDDQILFFRNALKYINGFELMSFCNLYSKTAMRCNESKNVLLAANDLAIISKDGGKFIKYTTQKGLKDIMLLWTKKEQATREKIEIAKKENKDTATLEKELKTNSSTNEELAKIYNTIK